MSVTGKQSIKFKSQLKGWKWSWTWRMHIKNNTSVFRIENQKIGNTNLMVKKGKKMGIFLSPEIRDMRVLKVGKGGGQRGYFDIFHSLFFVFISLCRYLFKNWCIYSKDVYILYLCFFVFPSRSLFRSLPSLTFFIHSFFIRALSPSIYLYVYISVNQ